MKTNGIAENGATVAPVKLVIRGKLVSGRPTMVNAHSPAGIHFHQPTILFQDETLETMLMNLTDFKKWQRNQEYPNYQANHCSRQYEGVGLKIQRGSRQPCQLIDLKK